MSLRERVLEALADVYDPELDETIVALRFVATCEVSPDGDVEIALRLPTPQCAPNFAFLMAADARAAVRRLSGVRSVAVRLIDHYTGEEINEAISAGEDFAGAFPGETQARDLEALRELFQRKALVARESRICERLLADGLSEEDLCALTVGDLGSADDAVRCLALRAALGLGCAPGDPAFVLPNGWTLTASSLHRWLRTARLMRLSLEVNGGICRDLLANRYSLEQDELQEVRAR